MRPTIVVGGRFGYRQQVRALGEPLRPVEVVRESPPRLQKARIRWLGGELEGLEEWVPKGRLVVEWAEAEAFLRDEHSIIKAWESQPELRHTTEWEAIQEVFFGLPRDAGVDLAYDAREEGFVEIEDLAAFSAKYGIPVHEVRAVPHAFTDRFGTFKAPYPFALRVAQLDCTLHAREVLGRIQKEEEKLQRAIASGYWESEFGDEYSGYVDREKIQKWLGEKEPIFRLVRAWCGAEGLHRFDEVRALRAEVERLRTLLEDTARFLKGAGHHVKAGQLIRDLRQGASDAVAGDKAASPTP